MPSVVATIKVKEDKIEEAVALVKELSAETLSNEPGTLAYVFHQRVDEPTVFVAYEKYESEEAFKTHSKNLASKGAAFASILAGPPEILMLEEV
ncbi:MAG: putative quinol monooxygenase [Myxococcota bacterium]